MSQDSDTNSRQGMPPPNVGARTAEGQPDSSDMLMQMITVLLTLKGRFDTANSEYVSAQAAERQKELELREAVADRERKEKDVKEIGEALLTQLSVIRNHAQSTAQMDSVTLLLQSIFSSLDAVTIQQLVMGDGTMTLGGTGVKK